VTTRRSSSFVEVLVTPTDGSLFGLLFTPDDLWKATSDGAWIEAMLEFERELVGAQADEGLVPQHTADLVDRATRTLQVEPSDLARAARSSGNPVVPLVAALREAVGDRAAGAVHRGATSQDALDTAAMLVVRRAGRVVLEEVRRAADRAADLAGEHRSTLITGRTLLQQAIPVTFGLKAAGWLSSLSSAGRSLRSVLDHDLALQFGGAAGTLASLGPAGVGVMSRLAGRLDLADPGIPWHTDRVRMSKVAASLATVAGAGAKVAQDLLLLGQVEVGEVTGGKGGSSAMPHKRNPVEPVLAAASARRAAMLAGGILGSMAHEHERAAGAWHAEWQTLNELLRATGGCATNIRLALEQVQVQPQRMLENVVANRGVFMAERVIADIVLDVGWERATTLVAAAVDRTIRDGSTLADELAEDDTVGRIRTRAQIHNLCDPATYLGASGEFVDRALLEHRREWGTGG